jgi:plasmid stabilization system protein ParE
VILDYLASKTISSNDLVVVSPDVGGVARARAFAKKLSDAPLAIVDKRRHGHNVAEVITTTKSVHYPLLYIFWNCHYISYYTFKQQLSGVYWCSVSIITYTPSVSN